MSVHNVYDCQIKQGQAAIVTAGAPLQTIPTWHPQLAAVEKPAGTWYMLAQYGRCYGVITLIRRGDELGYRLDTWAIAPADRQPVGYYLTLRAAAEAAHARFLRGHGQPGAPNEVRKPV
ncbi:MAG TPA: hypothetical protein PK282_00775 [Rhodoglobus sp.]|nr:hypothetical protein [Rhodoglobus sp.]HPM50742.1 hypothetical protein [Rhodoglobus sp.]